ncbi:hypothetical protein [Morganella psychrotolerans]|uniref:Tail spike TSP1/Gp66 N-terminal domain-containing protein n=1 Tax=Morganella psychrotolerans TaxID=368603 RepID=A0A1B8HQH2_9GAMM|nr:hypothetical protein [Morganella psychrotolerans]OBU11682.1 hypothetical protein AYY17_02970 [Morganella psychrotolerans]
MATIPTQNAVPSEAPRDLKFNSGKIDEFVTSKAREYFDRSGKSHLTIEGMKWMVEQVIETFKVDMNQAIIAAGYIPMDSFQKGAEITQRNQILRDEVTGEYYRWDGDLPKVVPVGSTPESAGGVGVGKWVGVGDASLRSDLARSMGAGLIGSESGKNLQQVTDGKQGKFSFSAVELGCIADRVTDNTFLIQEIIDNHEDGHVYLTIEPNVLWHFKDVNMKNGVNIIDMSGWDDEYSHWNEHIKYHFNHNVDNNQHNGNTFHILGRHHPALVVDNIGTKDDPEGEEHRASLVLRENGRLRARVGIGRSDSDSNFIIADNKLRTRFSVATTNEDDFELGLNSGPVSGVDYTYGSIRGDNVIHRKYSGAGKSIQEQYFAGGAAATIITYNPDGSISYSQGGSNTATISSRGEITGTRKLLTYAASLSLMTGQSGSILTNHSSSATSGYILPAGSGYSGVYYTFINTTGAKITVSTRSNESFLDGSSSKDLTSLGGSLSVISIGNGKWATR